MLVNFLAKTNSIALTWTADGEYRAVRIRRTGETVQVEKVWGGRPAEGQQRTECLAAAFRELGADDSCVIVAGPAGTTCGFVDLPMPHLPAEELKKALRIELSRQLPLNPEKLAWGYRRLPGTPGLLRAAYWREGDWQAALNELGAIPTGVDYCLSPATALDPLFAGVPVMLPGAPGTDGLLLQPNAAGGRDLVMAGRGAGGVFGAPPQPLTAPGIGLCQQLDNLPPARQQEFVGALLLAMYAVGPRAAADRKTLFPIPVELRVPRNRAGRMTACFLGLCLAIATGWFCVQQLAQNVRRLADLRAEAKSLQDEKLRISPDLGAWKKLDQLEKEIQGNPWLTRPPAAACLADLSNGIPEDAWVRTLAWNEGKISLELTTANKDLDPVQTLDSARNLKDVTQESKRMEPGGAFVIRLNMTAAKATDSPAEGGTPEKSEPANPPARKVLP